MLAILTPGAGGLQRLFAGYAGAGPKWDVRSARLHEAPGRIRAGTPAEPDVPAAELDVPAADLSRCDQAHPARDLTAVAGAPPTSCRTDQERR
ncbi:hypothetical protein [Paractinoplanes brasiliensis]|uniref:hypothetical protein n=1 Tax=Paractinoplanes brasiliensis TaxID=52695 RepID=UPI00105D4A91|nr:hypothetical protein [Actinoplanes brasiliensis]GID27607.1 hypothetical protein Abr02nite_25900 [Actinoplanes brasiliensis]